MNHAPEIFALTAMDKSSVTWTKLVAELHNRIATLRAKNDDVKLDPIQTAVIRGQIATLKGIISLGITSPVTDD